MCDYKVAIRKEEEGDTRLREGNATTIQLLLKYCFLFFFGIWEDYVSLLKSGNMCNITMFYYHYKRENATTVGICKNCVVAACGKTYLEYQSLVIFMIYLPKIFFFKSRIQETLNLSTDADRSTDTFFLLALPYG